MLHTHGNQGRLAGIWAESATKVNKGGTSVGIQSGLPRASGLAPSNERVTIRANYNASGDNSSILGTARAPRFL
jgi:hypothetical protein